MKKVISWILSSVICASLLCMPSFALADSSSEKMLQVKGTELLEDLLSQQFESFKTGKLIDTSTIFAENQSTHLYNQYLNWYTRLTDATGEYWTGYNFDLQFVGIKGHDLTFTADLIYNRTCSKYASEQHDFSYTIRVDDSAGAYYISEIDTEEGNFYDFKGLMSRTRTDLTQAASDDAVDSLISDYVAFKDKCSSMKVEPDQIVDMDAIHNQYQSLDNIQISPQVAADYSYDGERGRKYADKYYSTANSCFYEDSMDCTNFVSQCIWAAYGGWADGDSTATMSANIAARKRMQSSASLDNWFGHQNGFGNPWGSVNNLWTFATGSPATGPKATGVNNGKVYSTIGSTSILTGHVLQFRTGSTGDYGHSVYVSGGTNDSYANIKVTQHTDNKRRQLDEVIRAWGSSNCYMRQLKFTTAKFDR